MNVPKRVRDQYFLEGVQHRIEVFEEELAILRAYLGQKHAAVADDVVARKNAKHKVVAVSSKMQRWWDQQKKDKVIKHRVKRRMTEAQRLAHSETMKRIWAERTPEQRIKHAKLMQRARKQA